MIGIGVVLDPKVFIEEIQKLKNTGACRLMLPGALRVFGYIMPYHKVLILCE
jgi:adenylosuccinate synthase